MIFTAISSETTTNDFVPQTEKRKSLRQSLRKSLNLTSSLTLEDKVVTFIRGKQVRHISLAIYPKQGILLQFLREEFGNQRLSYFLDPNTKKEVDYNGLWELISNVILVMEDGDDVNAVVYAYEKGDNTFSITNFTHQ